MTTQELIDTALESAVAIAWDGCHKIYVLMDEEQASLMLRYGYGNGGCGTGDGDSESRFQRVRRYPRPTGEQAGRQTSILRPGVSYADDPAQAALTLRDWWEESCCLRFISTVRTVPGDPNEGFDHIVAQGKDWHL